MMKNRRKRLFIVIARNSYFPLFIKEHKKWVEHDFYFPQPAIFCLWKVLMGRSSEVLWEGLKFILKFWHERENCQSRRLLLRFWFYFIFFFFFQFRMINIHVQILLIILLWNSDCQIIPRIEECGLSCSQVISYLFLFAIV